MQKTLSTYLNLCTEVYDLSKPNAPVDAYNFYRDYARQTQGKILEPMCGTGRFLLPLIEEGFDVQGFDASGHMLDALRNKAKQKNLLPGVWQGFIEDLKRPEKYNLIFIPSGSFGLITEQAAVKNALKIFYNHLNDDGIFLFEGETHKSVPTLDVWRGSQWKRPDGKTILLSICANLEGNICSTICKYELVDKNNIIHTEIEDFVVRLYEPDELISLLQEAGFNSIRTIKAFDKTQGPDKNDESIVYECRK